MGEGGSGGPIGREGERKGELVIVCLKENELCGGWEVCVLLEMSCYCGRGDVCGAGERSACGIGEACEGRG